MLLVTKELGFFLIIPGTNWFVQIDTAPLDLQRHFTVPALLPASHNKS